MPWIKSGINKIIPSVIYQPIPQIPETLKLLPKDAVIVDVGAGGRQIVSKVIGVDFIPFKNTRVVSDIHSFAFKDESVDAIFCTGTLEHIENPSQAMKEIFRVLKPGGIGHFEVPFMQPYHKDPEDYWRWTLNGLRLFARLHGFEEIHSGVHLGPSSALNALIIAYWQSWFRNRYIRKGIDFLLSLLLFPFKYLDVFLLNKNVDIPSGVYYVGSRGKGYSQ